MNKGELELISLAFCLIKYYFFIFYTSFLVQHTILYEISY